MQPLTIIEQHNHIQSKDEFTPLENQFGIQIPNELKDFLLHYEGAMVKTYLYQGEPVFKEFLLVRSHAIYASMESILEGYQEDGISHFIPFAIDSGGWDYSVSVHPDTYGQVWVNQFDSGDDDPMKFVAPSFSEFINGLELGKY